MSADVPFKGNILCGELRGKPVRNWTDPATGQRIKVQYLKVLCLDDYNEEEFESLKAPADLDHGALQIGASYAFPVTQYVDKKTGKLRRSLRVDVPVFPVPMIKMA